MERSQAAALDGTGGPAGCLLRHLYAVPQGSRYGHGGWWRQVAVSRGASAKGTSAPPLASRLVLPLVYPVGGGVVHTAPLGSQTVGPSPAAEETVACILPFTSGGFLYIALVNVLPDLLEEDDPW